MYMMWPSSWEEERETAKEEKHFTHEDEKGGMWAAHMQKDLEREESSTLKVNAKEAVIPVISEAADL